MPALNFRNRFGKKDPLPSSRNDRSNANAATAKNPETESAFSASSLWVPPEEDRALVRERVLMAAQVVFVQHAVNPRLSLDEDPDLTKGSKEAKREQQYAAYAAHTERLRAILLGDPFLHIISNCLFLTSSSMNSSSVSKTDDNNINSQRIPSDTFGCVALLLCNFVILVANKTDQKSNRESDSQGYDARMRNVLRMASIQLLAEKLEEDDVDGRLWARLEERQHRTPITLPSSPELDESSTADNHNKQKTATKSVVTTQLSELLEEEYQHEKEEHRTEDGGDDGTSDSGTNVYQNLYRQYATQKFQALEQAVADMMMNLVVRRPTEASQDPSATSTTTKKEDNDATGPNKRFSRKNLVRAAKIGGVGVVAGTLFAVTGGMAAPAIAAGLGALGVGGSALALAASPAALIALFGVGGGGLSAYKMKRRTDGLSEFTIRRADTLGGPTNDGKRGSKDSNSNATAQLHTTVCISGWLKDKNDFQRPWGVTPPHLDRLERLQRFFTQFDPDKVQDAKDLAQPFNGNSQDPEKEEELWEAFCQSLQEQYGRSPDEMLPLDFRAVGLTHEEQTHLAKIFAVVMQSGNAKVRLSSKDSSQTSHQPAALVLPDPPITPVPTSTEGSEDKVDPLFRVWDYQTEFGGDVYTIEWEGALLLKMCQVINNMALELAKNATQEVLKKTALASIMSAVAFPVLLVNLAGAIDNDWTLVTMRSDMAGVELAKSLLQSDEERPVNLIGQSFGGRVVCACLSELSRHQAIWEKQQRQLEKSGDSKMKLKWKKKGDDEDAIEYKREPASIVQDVVIMGTPLFVSRSSFRGCRRMVAGRFVNCYSRKDWILSLMFQYKNPSGLTRGVCGTGPIEGLSKTCIENYDVSGIVSSWHPNYCRMVPEILDFVGFDQPMPALFKMMERA